MTLGKQPGRQLFVEGAKAEGRLPENVFSRLSAGGALSPASFCSIYASTLWRSIFFVVHWGKETSELEKL
jgi:hypothetical protein